MKINLSKYALEQYREKQKLAEPGPVVTISRLFGCPSKPIADDLTKAINSYLEARGKGKAWEWISKEILEETARELKMHPSRIEYVFNYEEKSLFSEILAAQSTKYYTSDKRIRKTIGMVIRSIAEDGNMVIVGRGAAAIARDIKNSLHVKLIAPDEWRAMHLMKKYDLPKDKAIKWMHATDLKRKQFLEYFYGKKSDDTLFDLVYNCAYISKEMIVESIMTMLIMRQVI